MRIRAFGARLGREQTAKAGHAVDVCTLLELRRGRPGVPRQYAGTRETVPRSDEDVGTGVLRERIHSCRDRRATDGTPRRFPGTVAGPGGERGRVPLRVPGEERRFAPWVCPGPGGLNAYYPSPFAAEDRESRRGWLRRNRERGHQRATAPSSGAPCVWTHIRTVCHRNRRGSDFGDKLRPSAVLGE